MRSAWSSVRSPRMAFASRSASFGSSMGTREFYIRRTPTEAFDKGGAPARQACSPGKMKQNGHTNGHATPIDGGGVPPAAVPPTTFVTGRVPLDPRAIMTGKRLVLLGGTGFLGKIFTSMLLYRFPEVGRVYLLVRKGKAASAEARFFESIATSETFRPLRDRYGDGFEAFLREKVVPIDGDVSLPLCGIDVGAIGTCDAVVNVAGVVDFNPPLDEALDANAFGAQNLVALARGLGN